MAEPLQPRMVGIVRLPPFDRAWKRLGLRDEDWDALKKQISAAPAAAPVVAGAGGLRKARFAPPSWRTGKSGAARVRYYYHVRAGLVFMIAVYSKREQADLTPAQRAEVRRIIGLLNREFPA